MSKDTQKGLIIFDHVSKRYRLGALGTLRGTVSALLTRPDNESDTSRTLWALKDVSFRLEPGRSLGLIGPNGAGKSTALKLLSSITKPTSGRIAVFGRTTSLIELGAGFHPELTGRENIYLNGAILGLTRRQINSRLDAIIAFSQIERFIDTPVKRYSSGMYVRLGFAVAAHVEPDILLVDEVLAVGDASFRHRCTLRMDELRRNGTTIVFVSHNMHQVRSTCDTALLMVQGQIKLSGSPDEVIAEYERITLSDDTAPQDGSLSQAVGIHTQTSLLLKAIEINGPGLATHQLLRSDQPATLKITYQAANSQPVGRIDVRMLRQDGTLCTAVDSTDEPSLITLSDQGTIEIAYDPLQLSAGEYIAVVRVTDPTDTIVIASGQSQPFEVSTKRFIPEPGIYIPRVRWETHASPISSIGEV